MVWPESVGPTSARRCFCCLNRLGYSFSALFDSSIMSTDEVYKVTSQLAWWLLRKNYLNYNFAKGALFWIKLSDLFSERISNQKKKKESEVLRQ